MRAVVRRRKSWPLPSDQAAKHSRCYPTYADAIHDRLVHNARRIELPGESLRRARGKARPSGARLWITARSASLIKGLSVHRHPTSRRNKRTCTPLSALTRPPSR